MRVLVVYNKDFSKVIYQRNPTKEIYSEKTVFRIKSALERAGHYVEVADGNMEIIDRLKVFFRRGKGIVFNLSYGIQGESRYSHIPSILEMLGVPYTGSTPEGHAVALDKALTKIAVQYYGIKTPDFMVFKSPEKLEDIKLPVIVKPRREALSLGVKVAKTKEELKKAVREITDIFGQEALVEKFIRGREFSVALIGNGKDLTALPVLEFDLGGNPEAIQTTFLKRHRPIRKICPAEIPENTAKKMQEISKRVFNILELRDYARVDLRMDESGEIYFLEINSQASLGETGSFIHSARAAGMDFDQTVIKILDAAVKRYQELWEEYDGFEQD
ncbi:ATP-grasp domain-containing protein [Persephonella atlantica]|uniref:ATP-grasp domain-containing protein n=1 Tax=Persephonella atlantica TaxID=2699429 RepID=A0ABS1GH70_9AQUI|nr:ATP-grasp domain-containing protein [Persephonella atlantica]MBK3332275.1 ATP-grasp domain-containing protein [Persephonella atlantica]